MSNEVTATFEVVTPLFLGGADPSRVVELRAPSIKGMLRFWWRALAWSRCGGDLDQIRGEEQQIFGAAGDDHDNFGQSSFGLRARWLSEPNRLGGSEPRSLTSGRPGVSYLGYGIINRGQGYSPRPCYQSNGLFELTLYALNRKREASGLRSSLLDAIKTLGLLGGLGGRSRRGWGSVMMTELKEENDRHQWKAPQNLNQYKDALLSILHGAASAPEPCYSGFGKGARLHVFGVASDALTMLDQLGQAYQAFRREQANRSFIFGLPHLRFRGDSPRRASPLLFHLHNLGAQYAIAATFLRAPFLKEQPCWEEYDKVNRFLDALPAALKVHGVTEALTVLSGAGSA